MNGDGYSDRRGQQGMVGMDWSAVAESFRAVFPDLLLMLLLLLVVAYHFGWSSLRAGLPVGALAIVGIILAQTICAGSWVARTCSGVLALVVAARLFYAMVADLPSPGYSTTRRQRTAVAFAVDNSKANLAGVFLVAWVVAAHGLHIRRYLVHSQAADPATDFAGVIFGGVLLTGLAAALAATGVFRRLPRHLTDGAAAAIVTCYGIYFLTLAAGRLGWFG